MCCVVGKGFILGKADDFPVIDFGATEQGRLGQRQRQGNGARISFGGELNAHALGGDFAKQLHAGKAHQAAAPGKEAVAQLLDLTGPARQGRAIVINVMQFCNADDDGISRDQWSRGVKAAAGIHWQSPWTTYDSWRLLRRALGAFIPCGAYHHYSCSRPSC